jgi:O-acetyl-ADP-ribose deacetylase
VSARLAISTAVIECVEGDIAAERTEAVVNAANNHLWMGSGVAGALKRAGGREIEDEAVRLGPIRVGEAVVTGGGRLNARFVIHAAAMGQDLVTNADLIRQATRSSLKAADENDIRSIAFPSLGTGVGGFPLAECAEIMIGEAIDHVGGATGKGQSSRIELVRFVLWSEDALCAFAMELERRRGRR